MKHYQLTFPFFTRDELGALAPDLLEVTTDRPLLVGEEFFYLAQRIAERFSTDGVYAESSEVLHPAGSYVFADVNGDQWDVAVTTAQRGLLSRAAGAIGASEANVLAYVAAFANIPVALHYDDWTLATPESSIPPSTGTNCSFREYVLDPPFPFVAQARWW